MHNWKNTAENVWELRSPFEDLGLYYRVRKELNDDGDEIWISDDDLEVGEYGLEYQTLDLAKEAAELAWETCKKGIESWETDDVQH